MIPGLHLICLDDISQSYILICLDRQAFSGSLLSHCSLCSSPSTRLIKLSLLKSPPGTTGVLVSTTKLLFLHTISTLSNPWCSISFGLPSPKRESYPANPVKI